MIDLKDKRILLVGGAGFIGHHLALCLARAGARVGLIDSLQVNNLLHFRCDQQTIGNRSLYLGMLQNRLDLLREAKVPVFIQDARNYHQLGRIISTWRPQVLVHLAAVAHAGKSNKDPYSTFDHSLRTLENALDCARDTVEHFIYFSSSMVYGDFEGGQVNEQNICEPKGIYGALKYAGEKIVIGYHQVFDMPYTIIRPSALYGERCVSRRVCQIFIENALQDMPLTIHGDGSERLDFTYIDDLVTGLMLVIAKKEARNQIFNLTYGASRSVREVVDILQSFFPDLPVHLKERDKLMPERGTLSVEKAKDLLGYKPGYPLEKGLEKYVGWYRQFAQEASTSLG
jgi:nucleoside-diphosphate-sugar epimerase